MRMPWMAKYNTELKAVVVVSQGIVSPEELREQVQSVVALGRDHATDRFLFDDEHVTSAMSAIDLVSLVDAYAELGLPQSARIAVLLPKATHSARAIQFYETAARNRAYNVRVFPGRVAAELWLMLA
ncbi:MAG TPA: hypothetical protein VI136_10585 [Verrucomicrobiae bacterium]